MYEQIINNLNGTRYERDYPLSDMTSYRLGGNADLVVYPDTVDEFDRILRLLGDTPRAVMGSGSNFLVSDEGFRGVVISVKKLNKMKICGNVLLCQCGVKVSSAVKCCLDNCLTGLEFAVDIPGSIGGMVAMNAGCYNKSTEDAVCFVVAENGTYNKKQCEFAYRKSRFLSSGEAVYSVGFLLKRAEQETIDGKLSKYKGARSKNQPKGNSCGSVFLNEGFFAGKIIDQAGLKGYRIGGARVSESHANFILSDGGSAQDVYDLIKYVKRKVYIDYGIELHEEVRYLGKFDENRT
ncbi:MAG: UDP-N-acetylmuramate dehydrogenase [Clostridia bacterium]|nr:UDP-N-acetylmuramate dehydrogenase [Clostridia bacterium]